MPELAQRLAAAVDAELIAALAGAPGGVGRGGGAGSASKTSTRQPPRASMIAASAPAAAAHDRRGSVGSGVEGRSRAARLWHRGVARDRARRAVLKI